MCRPLWSCWVQGRSAHRTVSAMACPKGEGSHGALARYDVTITSGSHGKRPNGDVVIEKGPPGAPVERWLPNPEKDHPFECIWTRERTVKFQPQGDRFYGLDDLPTREHFDAACDLFEQQMGNWERLRDWVLAAAKLYGDCQRDNSDPIFRVWRPEEPLWMAANSTLKELPRRRLGWPECPQPDDGGPILSSRTRNGEPARWFDDWADTFSDRKNRVPLWAN